MKKTCSYIVGSICSRNMCGPEIVTVLLLSIVPSAGDELLLPKNIFFISKAVAGLCLFLWIMVHVVSWWNSTVHVWKEMMLACSYNPTFQEFCVVHWTIPHWSQRMAVHMLTLLKLLNCASLVEMQSHCCRGRRKKYDRDVSLLW